MTATAVLEAIAEPTRRRILDTVREGECSVGDLVERVGMHQPGVSRHLKVLREAGLVEVRPDAQRRLYRLRAEPLQELDDCGRLRAAPLRVDDQRDPVRPSRLAHRRERIDDRADDLYLPEHRCREEIQPCAALEE